MLNVMIADDEARVCRLIQMLVDWDALNMKVVGTAANGLEALDLAERLRPDILITDIRMPGCNGLELIERIRQVDSQMEIIIISGYAEFEYAQMAIQRSVGGYLLKPIKKEALTATLEKLGKRLLERRNSESAMEDLRLDGQRRRELLKERLLDDLIHNRLDALTPQLLAGEYGFTAEPGVYQIFILKIDSNGRTLNENSLEMIREKAGEVLKTEVFALCQTEALRFYRTTGVGILHYPADRRSAVRRRLRESLNQLQAQKPFFGFAEFTLALGSAADDVCCLPQSMQEARQAVSERLMEGAGRLYEAGMSASGLQSRHILDKYNRTIDHAVDSLSQEEAARAADELAAAVRQTPDVRGYELLDLILGAARMFLVRLNPEQESELMRGFEEICESSSCCRQLFEALKELQCQQIAQAWEQQQNESIRPVRLAKQYIQQHYMEAIILEEVCAAIGFSVSYFSTMFKKETGEGFSKYLTRVRMEQAKTLLQDSNFTVSEICERVGYNDLKHFTGNFKKVTGLNPGQYRKLYG